MTPERATAIEFLDRMSTDPQSEYFDPYYKKIGVKFNGRAIFDVIEYCISEGWVRRGIFEWNGKIRMERGRPVTVTHHGKVELYRR